ncbi:MAG: class I SAM-dependent methyltransferase [Pseudomonadota bacterium]
MAEIYDKIGDGYKNYRQPDPRINQHLLTALGDAESVVNVGAGTGSYEPADRQVIAVEPSFTMLEQRATTSAPAVCAYGDSLPFADDSFDVALALLTIHHWPDQTAGVREMTRVARQRVVLFTWTPENLDFWLVRDYFPEILANDKLIFPVMSVYSSMMKRAEIVTLPIAHDCTDGFLAAYWRRPEAYLDAGARGAISAFPKLADVDTGLRKLEDDLNSGVWHERNQDILEKDELDLGYRLVISHLD